MAEENSDRMPDPLDLEIEQLTKRLCSFPMRDPLAELDRLKLKSLLEQREAQRSFAERYRNLPKYHGP